MDTTLCTHSDQSFSSEVHDTWNKVILTHSGGQRETKEEEEERERERASMSA